MLFEKWWLTSCSPAAVKEKFVEISQKAIQYNKSVWTNPQSRNDFQNQARWESGNITPLCCMMVVGLGAAAYCSMGKSLRWKGSQRRSARGEKGDDRYLLVRKLRPKRRTCFYGKFHLHFLGSVTKPIYRKINMNLRHFCIK